MISFRFLSQFYLPILLFILSGFSVYFTLRSDEIPVLGNKDRKLSDSRMMSNLRHSLEFTLQRKIDPHNWCQEKPDFIRDIHIAGFEQLDDLSHWQNKGQKIPQIEEDAVLRCLGKGASSLKEQRFCLAFHENNPQQKRQGVKLGLLELQFEFRSKSRKKLFNCPDLDKTALSNIETVVIYSFYYQAYDDTKYLEHFRFTGGLRLFPDLAKSESQHALQ